MTKEDLMAAILNLKAAILKLRRPTEDHEIEWRIGMSGISDKGPWAQIMPYVDSRMVMDRLDTSVGPMNWRDSYEVTDKGVLCTISVFNIESNEWVSKSDAAEFSGGENIDSTKTAVSNSFKRAAVKWGIGRDLYSRGIEYAEVVLQRPSGKEWNYFQITNKKTKQKTPAWWKRKSN